MDMLTGIGTMGSFMQTEKLKTQWKLKKQSGDLSSHAALKDLMAPAPQAAVLRQQQEEAGADTDGKRMREIMEKVTAGKKLSGEEMDYLKTRDPATWVKLKSAEETERSYREELRRCRTKEDVQRAKLRHMNSVLSSANAVANNPVIPEEKKQVLLAIDKRTGDSISAETDRFVKKGNYAKLPADREKEEAEKLLRKAAHPLEAEAEERAKKPEAENTDHGLEGERESEMPEEKDRAPEKADRAQGDAPSMAERRRRAEEAVPEADPRVRKLRRANANAAYARVGAPEAADTPALDVKA